MKKIKLIVGSLVLIHMIYFAGILLINMIPGNWVRENVVESADILLEEDLYPISLDINPMMVKWDNWTTAILYGKFLRAENKISLSSAIANNVLDGGANPLESLNNHIYNGATETKEYSRYWLGSELIFRPLSVFFNVTEIRCILFLLSTLLLFEVIGTLCKKISKSEAIVFAAVMCVSGMYLNSMCLTYCCEFFVTLIAVWLQLKLFNNSSNIEKYETLFFVLLGSVTMYFTWLSYPLVTLGITLLIMISIREKHIKGGGIIKSLFILLKNSICWCLGYVITMETKGVLSEIVGIKSTAEGRIVELIGNGGISERMDVVRDRMYGAWGFYNDTVTMLFVVTLIVLVGYLSIRKQICFNLKISEIVQYLFVCAYPLVWHFIFAAHSGGHGVASMLHVISAYGLFKIVLSLIQNDAHV